MKSLQRAFIGGVFGFVMSIGLLLLVNASFFGSSRDSNRKTVSQFEIKKTKKKKQLQTQKKKSQKKKSSLKPDLKNLISGMSFGIPAFELDFDSGSDFLNNGNYVNGKNVDQKPKVIYRPDLDFPEEAYSNNVSGYVVFGLFINANGELQKVDIIESSPEGVFDESALVNIKKWRFKPAVHKGVSVATWQEQRIVFNAGES
jgi:protein TonB